ncbi:hypothetical protein TWF718_009096 [Orbilia javanica]|uniref:Prolyl 4-hydroxylase alpha subunit Fe(2+) 2OG dioxygenase domain-containing protein n=1 Tax=Orbilia javanica TaxID=47235 RepID=A0AAN8MUF4_9PEZI
MDTAETLTSIDMMAEDEEGTETATPEHDDDMLSGSSGDDDESTSTKDKLHKSPSIELRLYNQLKDFEQYQGTFAFSSTYSATPNPGLKIKGLEGSFLRLPISAEDAARLSELGSSSPFGKGEKTIVDATVRSSRQLDPSELEFENPKFSDWLQGPVLNEIGAALGIGAEMRPKLDLYKLLVYEKGDHFKPHRDTPKSDGMIGTVVVILPSTFEGGIVTLSHAGEEMSFDFASDCKYSFGVAAWYSDVQHAVQEVTEGYRVALIYNLVVEGHSLSADGVAVKPELLEVLNDLKKRDTPVAYSLENQYSLAQRRLGFKGKDRYIITNLIAAINKVGGISMCCGDIQLKLSEDEDDMDAEEDESQEEGGPPDFFKTRGFHGCVEINLTSIEHIAGSYRHFSDGQIRWTRCLYSLGPPLNTLQSSGQEEEYTGNEGTLIHTWYRTSCILLWPTSEATSIVQQVKEPLLQWESVLKTVTTKSPPLATQEEEDTLTFTKVCALLERCICFPPPEDQLKRAGEIIRSMLQSLPRELIEKIENESIFELSNLVAPWIMPMKGFEPSPNPSQKGLLRIIALKLIFPTDLPFSFDPAAKRILRLRFVVVEPSTLLAILEAYQESPRDEILELLKSAFFGHPSADLLEDLYVMANKSPVERSPVLALLHSIPRYIFHEFIIAGLKERFLDSFIRPDERRESFRPDQGNSVDNVYQSAGYNGPNRDGPNPIWEEPCTPQIINYLQLLDEQAEPHRTQLIGILTESISIPLDKLDSIAQDEMYGRSRYIRLNVQVVEKLLQKPSLAVLPCTAKIRENMVEAVIKYFPCEKPEPPNYYLPSWTSPSCTTGTGCEVCEPINQFLQSSTEHHYQVQMTPEEADHYTSIASELAKYPNHRTTRLYGYSSDLQVRIHSGYPVLVPNFTIIKVAEERYRKKRKDYDAMLRGKKALLKKLNEPFNQFGKTAGEVGDSFAPSAESLSPANDPTSGQDIQTALFSRPHGPSPGHFDPFGGIDFDDEYDVEDYDDDEEESDEDEPLDLAFGLF